MTPGRNPSIRASARPINWRAASFPEPVFRSSVTERLPRIRTSYQRSRLRPSSLAAGRSTTSTSAPMSASSMPANGRQTARRGMLQLMAERVEPIDHPMPAQVAEYRRDDHYGEGRRQETRKGQAHEGKREREAHHFAGRNAEVERNGGHYRMCAGELPC